MNEEKALELIRAQNRLIAVLQTWIAQTAVFLQAHNISPTKEQSEEARKLREQISTLKGELYT